MDAEDGGYFKPCNDDRGKSRGSSSGCVNVWAGTGEVAAVGEVAMQATLVSAIVSRKESAIELNVY
jgi:hypothetical protein